VPQNARLGRRGVSSCLPSTLQGKKSRVNREGAKRKASFFLPRFGAQEKRGKVEDVQKGKLGRFFRKVPEGEGVGTEVGGEFAKLHEGGS